ncbi:unnamed protein product [Boreogadus saida]
MEIGTDTIRALYKRNLELDNDIKVLVKKKLKIEIQLLERPLCPRPSPSLGLHYSRVYSHGYSHVYSHGYSHFCSHVYSHVYRHVYSYVYSHVYTLSKFGFLRRMNEG